MFIKMLIGFMHVIFLTKTVSLGYWLLIVRDTQTWRTLERPYFAKSSDIVGYMEQLHQEPSPKWPPILSKSPLYLQNRYYPCFQVVTQRDDS